MRIKRLYSFLLKDYLGSFFATFFICLFVVLMQFLWKYVDEMVGKGLDFIVLAQFLYYAALSLIPMALPLAVLLSSLMTFGNLGERLELLAMKAAGISLFRIMRPFILFISFVCVGAFFFSNSAMPVVQTKLWTLLLSMRQKSPEVEIPAGEFYQGISNFNIYVRQKDQDRQLLKDMMIYDFTNGFENAVIIAADSGRIKMSEDKKNLVLFLYSGESFENLRQQQRGQRNVPYRRETFKFKEILIEFDSNFNMMDASVVSNRYLAKDMKELTFVIDSLRTYSDSLTTKNIAEFQNRRYFGKDFQNPRPVCRDSLESYAGYTIDDLWNNKSKSQKSELLHRAAMTAQQNKSDISFFDIEKNATDKMKRRNEIERHRKFTLSFACLIFFFIGAPLGAIIRKGGLGIPVVVSVFLFIIYYIVDNTGYKMARDGIWQVWQGIWLSSMVLLPLGVFLTYKAATDSMVALPNPMKWWSQVKKRRNIKRFKKLDTNKLTDIIKNYPKYGYDEEGKSCAISILEERGITKEQLELLSNSEDRTFDVVNNLYKSYNKNSIIAFVMYLSTILLSILFTVIVRKVANLNLFAVIVVFVTSILFIVYLIKSLLNQHQFYKAIKYDNKGEGAISFLFLLGIPIYFGLYFYFRNRMKEKMTEFKATKY